MAIDSVSSATDISTKGRGLGIDDFMKVLLTQLTYQDPLKPMDNQEFMAQLAQLTNLEQTQQLNTKMEQLINNQASLQSVGLIGRTVDVQSGGTLITGTVTQLSFANATPLLTVQTADGRQLQNVSLSNVAAVR